MPISLTDFKVLTFDCYGTLIDWETGIWDALQPLLASNRHADVPRESALEAFTALECRQQRVTPDMIYPALLSRVHGLIAAQFELKTSARLDNDFGNSIPHWPAFPDSAIALRYLKARYKLVILSNVDRIGFAASNRKLGVQFDAIYTAEDIGSYKRDPANFDYLLSRLRRDHGVEKPDILHTAQSLFHDHVPAKAAGLANAWTDRHRRSQTGWSGATPKLSESPNIDYLFYSLDEMANAVRNEAVGCV